MTVVADAGKQPKRRMAGRHLTIADVCEELGVSRSTFYDWRAKRKAPPCFKLPNGDLRIRRSDFEKWFSLLSEEAA
jgi:excisionase family DNA binding protein